jgi:hypothetical protein
LVATLEQPLVERLGVDRAVECTRQVLASLLLKLVVYPLASVETVEVILVSTEAPVDIGEMVGSVTVPLIKLLPERVAVIPGGGGERSKGPSAAASALGVGAWRVNEPQARTPRKARQKIVRGAKASAIRLRERERERERETARLKRANTPLSRLWFISTFYVVFVGM